MSYWLKGLRGLLLQLVLLLLPLLLCFWLGPNVAKADPSPASAIAIPEVAELDSVSASPYRQRRPSADGTGKVYMGREIARVMGHRAALWLERPSRLMEERPDLLVQRLNLPPDAVVAEVGAGTGLISLRMAQQLPQGKVLAVDVQPEMLDILTFFKNEQGVSNLEPVLGGDRSPNLPPESLDFAVLVDAYHEFEFPREMMQGIVQALKPGGRAVLAEYRGENPLIAIKPHHKMTQRQVRREMAAVGLRWEKTDKALPQQHLMFFLKD